MDALIDVVHPGKRNEVMLPAGVSIVLRELDLIPAFQTVHDADVHAVRTADFHMFLDRRRCHHVSPPSFGAITRTTENSEQRAVVPRMIVVRGSSSGQRRQNPRPTARAFVK